MIPAHERIVKPLKVVLLFLTLRGEHEVDRLYQDLIGTVHEVKRIDIVVPDVVW